MKWTYENILDNYFYLTLLYNSEHWEHVNTRIYGNQLVDDDDDSSSKEREKAAIDMIFTADINKLNKVLKQIIGKDWSLKYLNS